MKKFFLFQALQFENERLKDVRHNLESDITSRDRVINELRLHVPPTSSAVRNPATVASIGFEHL